MKPMNRLYEQFVRLLEEDPTLPDFPAACGRLHVAPGALNEILLRELGTGGEELLMRLRAGENKN